MRYNLPSPEPGTIMMRSDRTGRYALLKPAGPPWPAGGFLVITKKSARHLRQVTYYEQEQLARVAIDQFMEE